MLQTIAPKLWHVPHTFKANGIVSPTRMTVVQLQDASLWLHSPVPISAALRSQLLALGPVAYVVAPSKMHHLFAADCMATFPQATLFGAPGLQAKKPDLPAMQELNSVAEPAWQEDLEQIFFAGIPFANETVWFHKPSRSLIVTDLLQCYQGELSLGVRMYARLTGTRHHLAVPTTVRWLVKDRVAARASAMKIIDWPFERVIVAHNAIIDTDAHAAVEKAFACFK
jgi:Domain of unknown function (DUF4336)